MKGKKGTKYDQVFAGSVKDPEISSNQRDLLLESITFAATSFLNAENWRDQIDEVLAHFGNSLGVSRIYVFQNLTDDDGELYMSQKYEWVKEGISPQIDNPELKKLHYRRNGLGRLIDIMSNGGVIKGPVKDMPDPEREVLEAQDIISVFITPIFLKDKWWGFIGFDECSEEREWTPVETNMLKTAAGIFTSALENEAFSKELKIISKNFETLFNSSPDAIFVYDPDGHILNVNQAGCLLNGYTREQLTGMHFTKLIPEKYHSEAIEVFDKWLAGEINFNTGMAKHADGRHITVEIRGTRIEYYGNPALILLVRDISKRLQNERLLKQRLEFIEFISQLSSEFIKIDLHRIDEAITKALEYVCTFTESERGYVFQPAEAETMMKLTHEYCMPGHKPHKGILDHFMTEDFTDFLNTLKSGKNIIGHFDEIPHTSENKPMIDILKLLEIKSFINIPLIVGQHFIGYIGFDNVSRKTSWDQDTINAFTLTGQIIANATIRKKSEQDMLRAKEKAEENDKLKTIFLGQMSHELRTPLNSILGFAEILEREQDENELCEMASYIHKSGTRLLNTLNLLIDLSQIESNLMDTKLEEINLNGFIGDLSMLFSRQAAEKGLEFRFIENAHNVIVKADFSHLEKIVFNLTDNALKYTPKGFIHLIIDAEKSGGKDFAVLKVKDSGIGISGERQPFIFERFRQASEGYNREYEGAGIGLSVTKKMTELMHGRISLESAPNQGSCFTIKLPVISFEKTAGELSVEAEKKSQSPDHTMPAILVVEDERTHRKYLGYILSENFDVHFASDGREGFRKVNEGSFDAVIIDINLGRDMNGIELLHKIRKTQKGKNLPIAAVTANVLSGQKEQLLQAGFDFYLSKPFKVQEMKDLANKMLGKK